MSGVWNLSEGQKAESKEASSLFDMKISKTIIEEKLMQAFMAFDADGIGLIGVADVRDVLRQVMSDLGKKLTEGKIDELLSQTDIDEDGQIDYKELVKMLMAQ